MIGYDFCLVRNVIVKLKQNKKEDMIGYDFYLLYNRNKRKRNLIGIEKGTINRNKKTNKNNEKYKETPNLYQGKTHTGIP